jgi:hypothetical protein
MNIPSTTPRWAVPLITRWYSTTIPCDACHRTVLRRVFMPTDEIFQLWCPRCTWTSTPLDLPKTIPETVFEWVKKYSQARDVEDQPDPLHPLDETQPP